MRLLGREITGKNLTALQAGALVVVMASLSFAASPFYRWFCSVTGYAGATLTADAAPTDVLDETITIRFDASLGNHMPWTFRPVEREMTMRIGETGLAFYEATNTTDRPIAGQASYNVTPDAAGGFFVKIDCFCFQEQVLLPGQTAQMPVTFFVDPEIRDHPEAKSVRTITLSYTFYEIDLPEDEQAALDLQGDGPLTAAPAPAIDLN
jgi:cytochrome c oxidase assembly protein subunit 11